MVSAVESSEVSALAAFHYLLVNDRADQLLRPDRIYVAEELLKPLLNEMPNLSLKQRVLVLPEGGRLGVTDGAWNVPVGTQLYKSFHARDRGKPRAVETRLIERTANGWVSCKRELPIGRENAHFVGMGRIIWREHKYRLREIELARDRLHFYIA